MNFRYKNYEENKKINVIEDASHCNFDNQEIQITSKGLLRNSTFKGESSKGENLDFK